jgi:hypothetical protein
MTVDVTLQVGPAPPHSTLASVMSRFRMSAASRGLTRAFSPQELSDDPCFLKNKNAAAAGLWKKPVPQPLLLLISLRA